MIRDTPVTTLVYDLAIAPLHRSLANLKAILEKAVEYADSDEHLDLQTLFDARLYPNMASLVFQIRVATDTAKGAAARLSGKDVPSWPDDESTFPELQARVRKAIDYLETFSAEEFQGGEERDITLQLGPHSVNFTGTTYISGFVLPNFFFHVTTAYNILRHNGLQIGKLDYLGAPPV